MKTALVTGANKGIGFEVVKQLLNLKYKVILSARNEKNGLLALQELTEFNNHVDFLQMDVSDEENIKIGASKLQKQGCKLDVLVNNAAILIDNDNIHSMSSEIFMKTLRTNTLGPILVIQNFLELLKDGSKIINVSSGWGSINDMSDSPPAYSISKAALNAVTKQFAATLLSRRIAVNSVSPGWVKTDMGGADAARSVEKGAETIIWLCETAQENITGKFLRDKMEIAW